MEMSTDASKTIENNVLNGVNENQVVVSLPFAHYNELLRVYRQVMGRPTTQPVGVPPIEKEHTNDKNSSTDVTENKTKTTTEGDDISLLSSDTSIAAAAAAALATTTTTAGAPPPPSPSPSSTPKTASTIEIIEKEPNQTKPSSSKETSPSESYGKELDFNCQVQLERLSFEDIRKASSPLGVLSKMSFKTYMEQQKQKQKEHAEQFNKTKSKEPIDTTRRKSTIEQIRNNRESLDSKRKQSPHRSIERKKPNHSQINRREMIENLTRNFTAALHNDSSFDSLDDAESIKKWLVSKTIHSFEECNQAKKAEKKLH